MLNIKTILHPTDFSSQSQNAFRLACSLAADHGARVVLLHVTNVAVPKVPYGAAVADEEEYRVDPRRRLETIHAPRPDVPLEYRVENGAPSKEIVHIADEIHADLIVMGTHGRTGLERVLMGSVAEYVVRNANCPVMTVKGAFAPAEEQTRETVVETAHA